MQTACDAARLDIDALRPFGKWKRFTKGRHEMIPSSISRLFFGRGPAAILFRIGLIVAESVKRLMLWAWTHVGVEVLEAFAPSVTDRNASATVIWEIFGRRIVTAPFHRTPRAIFSATSHAMTATTLRGDFASKTSTTASIAIQKRTLQHGFLLTAITATYPSDALIESRFAWGNGYKRQATNSLTLT